MRLTRFAAAIGLAVLMSACSRDDVPADLESRVFETFEEIPSLPDPAEPWVMLSEVFASQEITDEYDAWTSFGNIEWTYADGEIRADIAIPARDIKLQLVLGPSEEGVSLSAEPSADFLFSLSMEPPDDYQTFYLRGVVVSNSLIEPPVASWAGLPGRQDEEDEFFVTGAAEARAWLQATRENAEALLGGNTLTFYYVIMIERIRNTFLYLNKGATGRAVFAEAFAAWGYDPAAIEAGE